MNKLNACHFVMKDFYTLITEFDSKQHNFHIYTHIVFLWHNFCMFYFQKWKWKFKILFDRQFFKTIIKFISHM